MSERILLGRPRRDVIVPRPSTHGRHTDVGMLTFPNGASQWYLKVRDQTGRGRHRRTDCCVPDVCAVCGIEGATGLRYSNVQSGARYCSEEHLMADPAWSDEQPWMA